MKHKEIDITRNVSLVQMGSVYVFFKVFDGDFTGQSDESYGSAVSAIQAWEHGLVYFKDAINEEREN